jgi:hypothetical protein
MSLISAALSLFAVVLMLAHVRRRPVLAACIGGLLVGLWVLPGPAKVAAPLAAILSLGIGESIAGLRPRAD